MFVEVKILQNHPNQYVDKAMQYTNSVVVAYVVKLDEQYLDVLPKLMINVHILLKKYERVNKVNVQ